MIVPVNIAYRAGDLPEEGITRYARLEVWMYDIDADKDWYIHTKRALQMLAPPPFITEEDMRAWAFSNGYGVH